MGRRRSQGFSGGRGCLVEQPWVGSRGRMRSAGHQYGARAAGKDLQAATEVNASRSPSVRTTREDLQAATGVNASALLSAVRMELGSPDISSTRVPKETRSECR
jgi:hypothetical protein